ncbi:metallophosphoesterase [Salinirubellus salinus]|uniref:Phosphoesterase n=1 Tax=Salinirubellus salinus TaxID=1364945 RepID=A0A9E7QZX3_9EURY|nr:metallophosphoesterase [Salinirubellus salinus]UWM53121.1 metallophosphoesterase [Salinirubellus salinus]
MLVVLSDTHGRDDPRLEGRTREAVDAADIVVHAGDFCTEPVLDAFEARCDLRAVHGNNDTPGVRERIPAERVVEWAGLGVAVAHGHDHTDVALTMFARQSAADLVVVGHSHRPGFEAGGASGIPRLNPGSHADPRRYRPAHAELRRDGEGYAGRIVQPDGTLVESFRL